MSVIHISKRENPYAQIDKRVLEDNRLSWRAKGILAYLLSKPSGWKVNVKDIWNNGAEGRNAVQDCLVELQKIGYAELKTVTGEHGKLSGSQWVISEEPKGGFSVNTDKPKTGKPINRKSGSRVYSNNEEVSNNELSESKNTPDPENSETLKAEFPQSPKVAPKGSFPNAPTAAAPEMKCDHCEGYGKIATIEGIFKCPACHGDGTVTEAAAPEEDGPDYFAEWLPSLLKAQERNAPGAMPSPTHIVKTTGPDAPGIVEAEGITLAPTPATIAPDQYPNAKTSQQLKEAMRAYFVANPNEWTIGVLGQARASNWTAEKIADCMTAFCAHQEAEGNLRRTYGQYKGMLVKWFLSQHGFDRNKPTPNAHPTQQTPPPNYTSQTRH